jgi:hypothetical protein
MRLVSFMIAVMFALSGATQAAAQGRGNGQAKKQPTHVTHTTETPKAKQPHTTTKVAKSDVKPVKAETRTAKADTKAAKAETKAARAETKAARKNGTVATTSVTPTELTTTTPTSQPAKNPKLEARLKTLLPPDMEVADARLGFKNWGQFVAAAHVSNNLGIPFADLKAKMTGLTPGPTPGTFVEGPRMSLGQAIQSWKTENPTTPTDGGTLTTTRIRNEVKKAEDAADADLRRTRS